MSTTAQINANRSNAQLSTGPTSSEGAARSAQNATQHGFTGQNIVIQESEKKQYEAHVAAYFEQFYPETHEQRHLVQQLADHDWTLHQITVAQLNAIAQMNSATTIMAAAGDPVATAALLNSLSRTLNNLSTYEGRRRRAAKAIREELDAVRKAAAELLQSELPQAATIYKLHKEQGQDWDPKQFGFVCSVDDIMSYLTGQHLAREAKKLGL